MTPIVPERTTLSAPYWEGADRGELRVQRCDSCGAHWHPPQPICPNCRRIDCIEWVAASGVGSVYSFTWVHHAAHRSVADRVPYAIALIELTEGPRMISNVVNATEATLAVGRRVRAVFPFLPGTETRAPQFELVDNVPTANN